MTEDRRSLSGFCRCSALSIVATFLLCTVLFYSSRAQAQESLAPEFLSITCGDRVVGLVWSKTVEESLDARVSSLRSLGLPVPASFKFGGYSVWRGESRDTSAMMLLRNFTRADSVSWTFRGDLREFVDPDSIVEIRLIKTKVGYDSVYVRMRVSLDIPGPYNGVGYFYSITYFDSLGTQRSAKADCFTDMPVHPVADQDRTLERVWVVPNPYHGSAPWDLSEGPRIQFVNLPARCTVSIYTIAGDLVREMQHPDPDYFNYGTYGGALSWNLKNQYEEDVVPGVYIFRVEGEGGEEYQGHFVIIY